MRPCQGGRGKERRMQAADATIKSRQRQWQRWAYMCNGCDRRWRRWTIVRRRQARAAKTTAGIECTQQWAGVDGGLVGCKAEVEATTTVAMLSRSWRRDWMVDCRRRVCRCVQGMAGGGQHDERGRWMMQGKQAHHHPKP